MCGIFGYISNNNIYENENNLSHIINAGYKIKNRGPERTRIITTDRSILMFHRLAIINTTHIADQPFVYDENIDTTYYVMCNGEIYNTEELCNDYNLNINELVNDIDIIYKLFKIFNYDFKLLNNKLNGEYALSIIKYYKNKPIYIWLSVDNCSVRPLFINIDNNSIIFSSLLIGITNLNLINDIKNVKRLKGGDIIYFNLLNNNIIYDNYIQYNTLTYNNYEYIYNNISIKKYNNITELNCLYTKIYDTLNNCVKKRLITDRPLGCLLSGGLDSSLIASIASKQLKEKGKILKTFTIGMDGGTDIKYAEMVAKHIGSEHKTIIITEEDALSVIPDIIKTCETYDTTTIRASIFQYLLAKYISENTDIKVLLNGDGADEVQMGYLYNYYAPNNDEAHLDNIRILREIHLYDGLRVDRNISHWGLEARLPYLDKDFTELYLQIEPLLKRPIKSLQMEKQLIRNVYKYNNDKYIYLPDDVLFRIKEAFSDGVSSTEKSWYQIIQKHIENTYHINYLDDNYKHMNNLTYENIYYRQTFDTLFSSDVVNIIPHYWLPNWINTHEPSARILSVYK
jgi:asparagine synthase (glutamine-hydrolysing)